MAGTQPSQRLLAGVALVLASAFGWAAWLCFTSQPHPASLFVGLFEVIAAVEVVGLARSPKADVERPGLLMAATTLAIGVARYLLPGAGRPALLVEGTASALAAVLLAVAATRRLARSRGADATT